MARIALSLAVLLFASRRLSDAAEVTETEGGFTYQVPSGWTVDKPEGEQYRELFGRSEDGNPANAHF